MRASTVYRPNSNITSSISIKSDDEEDYLQMREDCRRHRISQGEVLLLGYRENLQGAPDEVWRQFREAR